MLNVSNYRPPYRYRHRRYHVPAPVHGESFSRDVDLDLPVKKKFTAHSVQSFWGQALPLSQDHLFSNIWPVRVFSPFFFLSSYYCTCLLGCETMDLPVDLLLSKKWSTQSNDSERKRLTLLTQRKAVLACWYCPGAR